MSLVNCCTPLCPSPVVVNTPGPQGLAGYTVTTVSAFTIPVANGAIQIHVADTSWVMADKNIFISDGSNFANFVVVSVDGPQLMTIGSLQVNGDSLSGTSISVGALVMAGLGNFTVPGDLGSLTAFTDNSGGTPSDTIPASLAKNTIVIGPFSMALLVNGQLWKVPVPYGYVLNSATFRCDIAITTGAKAATLQPQINGVAVTGGTMAVAGTYASGSTQSGTAVSGANIGTAGLTLEIAVSGVTAFTEGYGHVELNVTNTDLTAFLAAAASKLNLLRSKLRHQ